MDSVPVIWENSLHVEERASDLAGLPVPVIWQNPLSVESVPVIWQNSLLVEVEVCAECFGIIACASDLAELSVWGQCASDLAE